MTGGYSISGAGYGTIIQWNGSASLGPVFSVQDPQNALLEQLQINAPDFVACIEQTSAVTTPSSMTYDGVYVGGSFLGTVQPGGFGLVGTPRANRGLECVGLPNSAVVHLLHFDGSAHFTDCSRATILQDFGGDGVLQVDGAQYEKSGFNGALFRCNSGNPCDNVIRDNQDFVGTDMYTESTTSFLSVSGNGGYPGQPGHVTIQGTECNTSNPQAVTVNNYEGRVTMTGMQFTHLYQAGHTIAQTGTRPVDILLLSDMFYADEPALNVASATSLMVVQNVVAHDTNNSTTHIVPNQITGLSAAATAILLQGGVVPAGSSGDGALAAAAAALDDFRQLGAVDMAINHP